MDSHCSIKNEKILFVLKETYAYPIWFLLPYFRKNNEVALFFINHAETGYNKCFFNKNTYYKFIELKNIRIYTLNPEAEEFTKCYQNPVCDMKYLEHVEKDICSYKNLNLQAIGSQQLTRYYHNRNYFKHYTYEQQLKWIELNYKGVERIINDFQPTLILDADTFEFPRVVLNEIAKYHDIPYISIEYPRYEKYKMPTYTIGYGNEKFFEKQYLKFMNETESELEEEINYVREFRNRTNIMSEEFNGTPTAQYSADGWLKTAKRLIGCMLYIWNQNIIAKNYRLIHSNPLIYPSPFELARFFIKVDAGKRKLYSINKYFKLPQKEDTYVYFPLHLIPEASTVIKAPYYINELHIIESVSKALPIGWKLYVKEHQSMLGERSLEFYEKVNRIPNCMMVQPNYYTDPKPWITNAKGVITITGTSAYEAVLLGKRAIVFGDVCFNVIEGVQRVYSYEELHNALRLFDVSVDNIRSCAAYIAAVKSMGYPIDMQYLMSEGEKILSSGNEASCEYMQEIGKLIELYHLAYNRIKTKS